MPRHSEEKKYLSLANARHRMHVAHGLALRFYNLRFALRSPRCFAKVQWPRRALARLRWAVQTPVQLFSFTGPRCGHSKSREKHVRDEVWFGIHWAQREMAMNSMLTLPKQTPPDKTPRMITSDGNARAVQPQAKGRITKIEYNAKIMYNK